MKLLFAIKLIIIFKNHLTAVQPRNKQKEYRLQVEQGKILNHHDVFYFAKSPVDGKQTTKNTPKSKNIQHFALYLNTLSNKNSENLSFIRTKFSQNQILPKNMLKKHIEITKINSNDIKTDDYNASPFSNPPSQIKQSKRVKKTIKINNFINSFLNHKFDKIIPESTFLSNLVIDKPFLNNFGIGKYIIVLGEHENKLKTINNANNNIFSSSVSSKSQEKVKSPIKNKPQKKLSIDFKQEIFQQNTLKNQKNLNLKHDSIDNQENEIKLSDDEPIEIIWEIGALKKHFKNQNQIANFDFLKLILEKTSAFLRLYIHIDKKDRKPIVLNGDVCGFDFEKKVNLNTHLVLLVKLFENDNANEVIIAKSKSCARSDTNRATVGVIKLNIEKLITPTSSQTAINNYILTVAHEILHILAFTKDNFKKIGVDKLQMNFRYLGMLVSSSFAFFEKSHWIEDLIPNDIMIPYSRSNIIVTVFTLEMIELASKSYRVKRKYLPNDFFLESMPNLEEFYKYKCPIDKKPKYDFMCSNNDHIEKRNYCSTDYIFTSSCEKNERKNGCHYKAINRNKNCMDIGSEGQSKFQHFEHLGFDSRCFETVDQKNAFCLKFAVKENFIQVMVGNLIYDCKKSGQIIEIRILNRPSYKIKCPDIQKFIRIHGYTNCPDQCNFNGFCSNGKCLCYDGYDQKFNCGKKTKTGSSISMFTEFIN